MAARAEDGGYLSRMNECRHGVRCSAGGYNTIVERKREEDALAEENQKELSECPGVHGHLVDVR